MFWDDETQPAVEAPLQDFFGVPFARQARFESAFFSNPEGRSFNSVVPMPFRKQRAHDDREPVAEGGHALLRRGRDARGRAARRPRLLPRALSPREPDDAGARLRDPSPAEGTRALPGRQRRRPQPRSLRRADLVRGRGAEDLPRRRRRAPDPRRHGDGGHGGLRLGPRPLRPPLPGGPAHRRRGRRLGLLPLPRPRSRVLSQGHPRRVAADGRGDGGPAACACRSTSAPCS